MNNLMPIEQTEFIDELQRWFHESTNMCHEDCYRFAFVIWQHKDKLSQILKADIIDDVIRKLTESEDTILSDRQYYTLMELKDK